MNIFEHNVPSFTVDVATTLIESSFLTAEPHPSTAAPVGSNPVLALAAGIVLGGFVEEQLYRGYILVRLTERLSLPLAIAPMLLFFRLLHVGPDWTGMLVATTTGLTLALLFVWRRSLVSAMIAHALKHLDTDAVAPANPWFGVPETGKAS